MLAALQIALIVFIFWAIGRIPGHIARKRNHTYADAITCCGWLGMFTFGLLWVAAMVWAFIDKKESKDVISTVSSKKCPHCAELIKIEANFCRFCSHSLDMPRDRVFGEAKRTWKITGVRDNKHIIATAKSSSVASAKRTAEKNGIAVHSVELLEGQ